MRYDTLCIYYWQLRPVGVVSTQRTGVMGSTGVNDINEHTNAASYRLL